MTMNIFSKVIWKLKVYRRHERLVTFHIAAWHKHAARVLIELHPAVYGKNKHIAAAVARELNRK